MERAGNTGRQRSGRRHRRSPLRTLAARAVVAVLAVTAIAVSPARDAYGDAGSGDVSTQVVYGEIVPAPNPYPWMTLVLTTVGTNLFVCGGSLIDPGWVLTAAHCVDNDIQTVRVAPNILRREDAFDPGVPQVVKNVIVHEDWDPKVSQSNDIALLELQDPERNAALPLVPLIPPERGLPVGTPAEILGWGVFATGPEDPSGVSPDLRRGVVQVLAAPGVNSCRDVPTPLNPVTNGDGDKFFLDGATMVCANGDATAPPGRSTATCSGDSGGPLLVRSAGVLSVAGLTSWGVLPCYLSDFPGISVRVSAYLDWIDTNAPGVLTTPDAPTGLSATPGPGTVALTWETPLRSGGYPVTGYTVSAVPTSGETSQTCTTSPVPIDGTVPPATSCVLSGLTNGTQYSVTVVATNTLGDGSVSAAVISSTPTAPGAPTGVAAAAGNREAALSWSAPEDDGGDAITGYTVTGQPSGSCSTSGETSCVVTDLTNDIDYTFTVVATNGVGSGAASEEVTVRPIPVPGAPTGVSGVAGDLEVEVSWSAPEDEGGSAITEYTVTGQPSGSCSTLGETSCVVTGLTNGTAYTFTVVATNDAGPGFPSVTSAPVTPRTIPGAPTGVSGVAGNARVSVSWTEPGDDGGSVITGYTVTGQPSGSCSTSDQTSCVVTGLTNGTAYTFTVVATNDAGSGQASSPSPAVTPLGAPNRPGLPRVTPLLGSLRVAVVPPTGGFTPTSYVVTSVPGSRSCTVTGSSGVCTITGLNQSTAYRVTAVALTVGGSSPVSPASAQVTPGAGSATPQFVDVPRGSYYVRPTSMLRDRGITTGYAGTNRFEPQLNVSRAEMAAFLWRMAGQPASSSSCGWADQGRIPSWARAATCWLRATGITTGYAGTNRFEPSFSVTRAEMAAFLWRFAGRPAASASCGFTDQASIPSWARTPACWLRATRITTNNPYRPADLVTRAEMSAFLYRTGGVQGLWVLR